MKKRVFSLMAGTAILFALACNSADNEVSDNDTTTTDLNDGSTAMGTVTTSDIKTSSDGRSYVVRARRSSSSTDGSGSTGASSSATTEYDTVWLNLGTANRYYTLDGPDTLYFDTDQFNSWWTSPETDNELKMRSGDTKVKVDDDGSYKIKTDTTKVKVDESGKTKVKKRDD